MKGTIIQREVNGIFGIFAVHTGILTEKKTVIHFDDQDKIIKESSLNEFANRKKVVVRNRPINVAHANLIVNKAREIMNKRNNGYNNQYDFLFNNCQDFTKECYQGGINA